MQVVYTPSFVRQYKKLSEALQEEVREKIALFCRKPDHPTLKAHKLKGKLKGCWSFSVNYRYRIVYQYDTKETVALLAVGDHSVYE